MNAEIIQRLVWDPETTRLTNAELVALAEGIHDAIHFEGARVHEGIRRAVFTFEAERRLWVLTGEVRRPPEPGSRVRIGPYDPDDLAGLLRSLTPDDEEPWLEVGEVLDHARGGGEGPPGG